MKKLIAISIFSILLFAGCEKETFNSDFQSGGQSIKVNEAKAKLLTLIKKHNLYEKIGSISKAKNARNARIGTKGNLTDYNYYQSIVKKVINPDDYECGRTIIDDYLDNLFAGFTEDDFGLLGFSGVPLDYEYVFGNTSAGQYFGSDGQYTSPNKTTFKDLTKFWDIPTDIVLRGAHGSIFGDVNKVVDILLLYAIPLDDSIDIANYLKIVFNTAKFRYYNHPILSFNAFAATPEPGFNPVKKIVMGDGIIQAYAEMGFSDVASKQIMAHEYGHHIQFAKNVDFGNSAEGTRRTELMADSFSAYYLTHSRGEAMNWKRVKEFLAGFYLIGDCAFSYEGHHGTPNQRMRAAEYGNKLANDATKSGKILSSAEFIILFDAALPALVAPDAI